MRRLNLYQPAFRGTEFQTIRMRFYFTASVTGKQKQFFNWFGDTINVTKEYHELTFYVTDDIGW